MYIVISSKIKRTDEGIMYDDQQRGQEKGTSHIRGQSQSLSQR